MRFVLHISSIVAKMAWCGQGQTIVSIGYTNKNLEVDFAESLMLNGMWLYYFVTEI